MFSLTDPAQKEHFQRLLYMLIVVFGHTALCWLCFQVGLFRIELQGFIFLFISIWIGHGIILLTVVSGFNKRISEPSMILPQMIWTTTGLLITAYLVDQMRLGVMSLFLAVMIIGAFRVKITGFIITAVFGVAGYGLVLYLLINFEQASIGATSEVLQELLQFGAFTLVTIIFTVLGSGISNLRHQLSGKNIELQLALEKVQEVAIKDDLTGVYNRRFILDVLERQKKLAERGQENFSLCFIDLDHFKKVNDNYGHGVGDRVLVACAHALLDSIRSIDYCARIGGEEFILVLTNSSVDKTLAVAERIRERIENLDFSDIEEGFRITASLGLTDFKAGESVAETMSRVDALLYDAKAAGRNNVKSLSFNNSMDPKVIGNF